MSNATRGVSRERQVRKLLEAEGWAVTRGAGSHGCADLWAAREDPIDNGVAPVTFLRLIQVKTDKRGPYGNFSPAAREELRDLARETGGQAELWHWPANKPCKIIMEDEWP